MTCVADATTKPGERGNGHEDYEIEITEEMVAAGASVLASHSRMFESLAEITLCVFIAMIEQSGKVKAKPLAFDILSA